MAAGLLRHWFAARGRAGIVDSAGLAALVGEPADPVALQLMHERQIDLSGHRAQQLTPEIATAFELILVMEEAHQQALQRMYPETRGRVHRLGRFGGFDIPDPYRRPRSAFERSLSLIERGLVEFERRFWSAA